MEPWMEFSELLYVELGLEREKFSFELHITISSVCGTLGLVIAPSKWRSNGTLDRVLYASVSGARVRERPHLNCISLHPFVPNWAMKSSH